MELSSLYPRVVQIACVEDGRQSLEIDEEFWIFDAA
jgi:hypothetical protein